MDLGGKLLGDLLIGRYSTQRSLSNLRGLRGCQSPSGEATIDTKHGAMVLTLGCFSNCHYFRANHAGTKSVVSLFLKAIEKSCFSSTSRIRYFDLRVLSGMNEDFADLSALCRWVMAHRQLPCIEKLTSLKPEPDENETDFEIRAFKQREIVAWIGIRSICFQVDYLHVYLFLL